EHRNPVRPNPQDRSLPMPATLHIWPNSYGLAAAATPGHASLEIQHHHGWREYISWWPTGTDKRKGVKALPATSKTWERDVMDEMASATGQRLEQGSYQPRAGQVQKDITSKGVTKQVWVQKPAHSLVLPGAGEGTTGVGLNLERIRDWWQVFRRAKSAQYR